jgi:hypothetical protein
MLGGEWEERRMSKLVKWHCPYSGEKRNMQLAEKTQRRRVERRGDVADQRGLLNKELRRAFDSSVSVGGEERRDLICARDLDHALKVD